MNRDEAVKPVAFSTNHVEIDMTAWLKIDDMLKELDEWRKVPSYYGIMTQSHQAFVLAMDKRGEYVEKQLQELLEQARDLNKRLDNIVAHR